MIENVAKSVRRKKTIDDAFMKELYEDVASLYRLNTGVAEGESVGTQKQEFGPLPTEAKALLGILGITWIGILIYIIYEKGKKKPQN